MERSMKRSVHFEIPGQDRSKLIEIGIPAYNEGNTIGDVLRKTISVIERLRRSFEIRLIVVDDASTDATGDVARHFGATVLSHEKNMGYGASIRTFLNYALRSGADIVILMDADGQHPPEEIPKLLKPILCNEADVVIGSRFLRGSTRWVPGLKKVGMIFYSLLASIIIRKRITDVTSGFRAMNRRALELVTPVYPDDYPAVGITVYMGLKGLRLMEVPVSMKPRKTGSSYIRGRNLLSYHVKVLKYTIMALINRLWACRL